MPTVTLQDGLNGYNGTDSAYIYIDNPTANLTGFLPFQSFGGGESAEGIIKFDLSSIPSNATVTDVTLSFNHYEVFVGSSVEIRRILRNWGQSTVTWNKYDGTNNWTTAGAQGSGSDISATLTDSYTVSSVPAFYDTTSAQAIADVQGFIDGTYPNYGWICKNVSGQGSSARSEHYATASDRPKITITYTVPATGRISSSSRLNSSGRLNAVNRVNASGRLQV